MKRVALVLSFAAWINVHAVDPIPPTWTNNPRLGNVYEVVKTVRAEGYGIEVSKGTKVLISRRYLTDQIHRDPKTEKKLALLVLGGSNQDDPGLTDARIPYLAAAEYLRPTEEAGPLPHWEEHVVKFADKEIPDLKPNHFFQHTFAVNLTLAAPHEGERPLLIGAALIVRMIKPSPHCLESEVTVRLKDPGNDRLLQEHRRDNPDFALAGPWYGSDYCVSYRDFLNEFHPTAGLVDENLPDGLSWDEAVDRFHGSFVLKAMQDAVVKVNPYSKADETDGRSAPSIRVTPIQDLRKEDQRDLPADGWVAEYSGNLYYSCAGGVCRAQGYRVALDGQGKVVRFLKNRLYSWDGRVELPLDRDDETRLIELCNDPRRLDELHNLAKTQSGERYAAKMSELSAAGQRVPARHAGNAYGTFVVHVSKVREGLGLNAQWPIYEGKAPKTSENETRARFK